MSESPAGERARRSVCVGIELLAMLIEDDDAQLIGADDLAGVGLKLVR